MGSHDDYGKRIVFLATDGAVEHYGPAIEVDLGAGLPARIDGAVGGNIAIEVESRTSKQVRGAVLDLICHPFPKKLLLLLPVHMANPEVTAKQSENILARFLAPDVFRVLLLNGNGDDPKVDNDVPLVAEALGQLGYRCRSHQPSRNENATSEHHQEIPQVPRQPRRNRGKYEALESHLRGLPPANNELTLTFEQVEEILGFTLPESAFKYREWWSNQTDASNRPQARSWINAGFRVDTVRQDRQGGWVRFVRH